MKRRRADDRDEVDRAEDREGRQGSPSGSSRYSATGAVTSAPAPKPATASPVIMPRRSGNHLINVASGTMYPRPSPMPPRTP